MQVNRLMSSRILSVIIIAIIITCAGLTVALLGHTTEPRPPIGWKNIKLTNVRICIPNDFAAEKVQGVEGDLWHISGEGIVIEINENDSGLALDLYKDNPDYREEYIKIGDKDTRFVFFRSQETDDNLVTSRGPLKYDVVIEMVYGGLFHSYKLTAWAYRSSPNEQIAAKHILEKFVVPGPL